MVESGHPLAMFSGAVGLASPDSTRVAGAGVQARPETLQFAAELSSEASEQAKRYESLCFDYSAASSGAVESAASVVEGMMRRFSGFLKMLEKYASPRALRRLESIANQTLQKLRSGALGSLALTEEAAEAEGSAMLQVGEFISDVDAVLPSWIDALKQTRTEVLAVSATLESLFGVVQTKAPPIFELVSKYFVLIISVYFVIFMVLTLCHLVYALWASRIYDPDPDREAGDGPPGSFMARSLRSLGCVFCCKACDDHESCFWSVILLMEIFWLVLFLTTFLMIVMFGVRAFVGAGCKPIYILGDHQVCGERLSAVGGLLQNVSWAFGGAEDDLGMSCSKQRLLVCQLIREKLYSSMLAAALGNMLAAAVTWMLILESAVLHERRHHSMLLESVVKPLTSFQRRAQAD